MANKRETITILGIDTATADNSLKDGWSEDIFNLHYKNGGIEQVYDFETIEEVDRTHSQIPPSNIMLKPTFFDDPHRMLYFKPEIITSSINPSEICECVAELDGDYPVLTHVKTILTFPSDDFPSDPYNIHVMQFGNILYITYKDKEWSFLYKMGNYYTINLSSLPDITFDVNADYHSLTDDKAGKSICSISSYNDQTTNRLANMTEVLYVKRQSASMSEEDEVIDTYNTRVSMLNNQGYIVGEFKVALGYVLFDGSIIKISEPKIVTSFQKRNINTGTQQSEVYGYTFLKCGATSDGVTYYSYLDYFTGFKVKINNIPLAVRNAIDGNIITGIKIIATKPEIPFDYHKLHSVNGNSSSISGVSRMAIVDSYRYQKAVDIWYELKEIDFEKEYTPNNYFYLGNDLIKDIEHNPVVEANYSHHTLTSEKKLDYNNRLHRYKCKNQLYSGYDYSLGDISQSVPTDSVKRAKDYLRIVYGTEQQSGTTTITFNEPAQNSSRFSYGYYEDRHGDKVWGYFPAFYFTASEDVTAEQGVRIEVKYNYTRNGVTESLTRIFENVSLVAGASTKLVDNSTPNLAATSAEISGDQPTCTQSMDTQSGYPIIVQNAHGVKYLTINLVTTMFAIITLKINSRYYKFRRNISYGWTFTHSGSTYYAVKNYIVYPDARAENIRFGYSSTSGGVTTNYLSKEYKLISDTANNQAFAFLNPTPVCIANEKWFDDNDNSATIAPAFAMTLTASQDAIPTSNTPIIVEENNKLYVSEENNPFYNAPKNIYTIGNIHTNILEIQAAIEHLSETKFGYYPLYVFSSDGIYSMEQGTDILYQSIQKISGEVKLENTNSTVVGTSAVFIGEKGVMELSQRNVNCISLQLDEYDALSRYSELDTDFRTYKQYASIFYNQGEREIIVYNPSYFESDKNYAYVYSLISKQWTRRNFSGRLIDGIRTLVNDTGVHDMWVSDLSAPLRTAKIYTRALKLGSHEFKKLERAIIRETHDSNTTFTALLQGSNNLKTWTSLRMLTNEDMFRHQAASWKYYRFIINISLGTTGTNFSITAIDLEYFLRFVHRLR